MKIIYERIIQEYNNVLRNITLMISSSMKILGTCIILSSMIFLNGCDGCNNNINNTEHTTPEDTLNYMDVDINALSDLRGYTITGDSSQWLLEAVELTASGGKPPYVWDLISGSSLPQAVWIYPNGYFAASYDFHPLQAGIYNFNLIAQDARGKFSPQKTFTLTVTEVSTLPLIDFYQPYYSYSLPQGSSNNNLYYGASLFFGCLGPSGYPFYPPSDSSKWPLTWTLTEGSLPPGLQINMNGDLAGIPTQSGTYTFKVKVTSRRGEVALCPGPSGCPQISIWISN